MSRLVVLMIALALLPACGKKEGGGEQTASNESATATQQRGPGRPAITEDDFSELEQIVKGSLRPYFDEQGTRTEITIAPGEYFDLYVFAEYSEYYPMSAAEYRLVLPAEVSVMGSANNDTTIAAVGKYDQDFGIAFPCMSEPKWWVVKYTCKAHEEFNGGTIEVTRGTGLDFIGFVTCDATRTMIRAKGGTAVLKKK